MTRFDVIALAWAVLLCLALGGALSLPAVLVFPVLLAVTVVLLGFLQGVAQGLAGLIRSRR